MKAEVNGAGLFPAGENQHLDLDAWRIAVLVPCFNEEAAVFEVVRAFRAALPTAAVYVYDNASTDRTAKLASEAGALVRTEPLRGKGNVVRRMFADVEADIYLLVDGDGTYDAGSAPAMVKRLIDRGLDMVVGARVSDKAAAYRPGHRFGNRLFTGLICRLFGRTLTDVLSGYRVFSRRFVKSFPALAAGFEIETELTIHAFELQMPVEELATPYSERPSGSASKLSTYQDGWRILMTILSLYKNERPLAFFTTLFVILCSLSLVLTWPLAVTYLQTGLVPRFPTAILATGIMTLAFLSLTSGIVLDTVTRGRRELKRLAYLSIKAPGR